MVRTRASGPPPSAQPAPTGRATRSRARPAQDEGSTSRQNGGSEELVHPHPIMNQPSSSMQALAAHYGPPARRAAPLAEQFSLSQISTRSEDENHTQTQLTADTTVEYVTTFVTAVHEDSADATAQGEPSQAPVLLHDPEGSKGTTQQSESQLQEVIALRTACLLDLKEASEKLVDQVFGRETNKSLWEKLVEVKRQNFSTLQEIYAEPKEPFINVQKSSKMVKPDVSIQARGVLVLANLAQLLHQVASSKEVDSLDELLKLLDTTQFPVPFSPWKAGEQLTDTDIKEAIEIRTQRCIAALENMRGNKTAPTKQKISDWVANFFCEANNDRRLIGENMSGICGINHPLPDEIAEKCRQRALAIVDHAEGATVAEVADSLKRAYPHKEWRAGLIDWGFLKFQEIQRPLETSDSEEDRPVNAVPSQAAPSEPSQPIVRFQEPTRSLKFTKSMVAFLHGKASGNSREQADSPPPPGPDEQNEQSARPPMSNDHYNKLLADRAAARLGGPQRKQPQPPPSSSGLTSANSRKRSHDQSEADEDDFEQDARLPDAQRRAELDRRAMPPPSKRRSPLPPAPPSAQPPAPDAEEEEDPFAATPPRPSATPAETDFRAISQKNRERLNPQAAERGGQRRVPWCNADIKKLIYLIATHHCAWSKIYEAANVVEKEGRPIPEYNPNKHFQDSRDQQAIRDKARNLKVDFLKADLVLPQGFDGINLGRKERDAVLARGKNPNRSEHDVDEDGRPTNTVRLDEQLDLE